MPDQAAYIKFAGRNVIQANPSRYPMAAGLANGYSNVLGPAPGIGYVLMLRRDWNQIYSQRNGTFTLEFTAAGKTAKVIGLYIISAVKVSGGPAGSDNAVYMLKLADKRWHARMSDTARQINMRCPAPPATSGGSLYYASSLDGGSPYTWARACQVVWNDVPGFGDWPGLPMTPPTTTPENFSFVGVPAIDALATLLDCLSCTITFNPSDGTIKIVQSGVTQAGLSGKIEAAKDYIVDSEPFDIPAALTPATVRVYFHRRDKHYGTERFTQRDSDAWTTNAWHKIDCPSTGLSTVAGTIVSIWDDLPAIYDFDGTLANDSDLNDRANLRAQNLLAEISTGSARRRTVYSGVIDFIPGSQLKLVQWRNHDSRPDIGTGLVTEIRNQPGLIVLPDSKTGLYDPEPGGGGFASETIAPPDLGRHSSPNYPPLVSIVTLDGSDGTLVDYDGDRHFWSGFVVRADPEGDFTALTTYNASEPCWIAIINQLTGSLVPGIKAQRGDQFLGKLNGSATQGGDTRPLYLVERGENNIHPVTLSASVASGASRNVTLPDGRVVSAKNQTTGTLAAGRASCYLSLRESLWYLTGGSGGQSYGIIEGAVAANFLKTSIAFLANVTHDDDNNLAIGSQVTVWNMLDLTTGKFLFEGTKNSACQFRYSPSDNLFRVVWVACPDDVPQVGGGEGGLAFSSMYNAGGLSDVAISAYYGG